MKSQSHSTQGWFTLVVIAMLWVYALAATGVAAGLLGNFPLPGGNLIAGYPTLTTKLCQGKISRNTICFWVSNLEPAGVHPLKFLCNKT